MRLAPRRKAAATSPPLLQAHALGHAFGRQCALDGVSLRMDSGDTLCVIGPNGSGKTTLFNTLSGQLQPQRGQVLFRGMALRGRRPDQIARLGLGRKFQVPSVFGTLSSLDNLLLARRAAGLPARPADVDTLLRDTGLAGRAQVPAGELSHGERQWLEIAMVTSQAPRLLLLDEPTAGMTQAETLATVALIRKLCQRDGIACIVVEHDMQFVAALESKVMVLADGRVIAQGAFDTVRQSPAVRQAYLGHDA
ncbi:Urea ABC transporter, ATPase protein UrtD [plant metagenome]|uniref:Urea ABC transporter, ATPase protein UrtD n=2 Tax=plant metagenome TaxID=1297885 RepID=A0A484P8J1_9ZZZZ